jgi:hypothetical protein
MKQLNAYQTALVRQALSEAIESVQSVIDGNLQLDKSRDTPAERRLRNSWTNTAKAWKELRTELGGVRSGERTTTQDFAEFSNQRKQIEDFKKKVARRLA